MKNFPIVKLARKLISIPSISPLDLGCQEIIANRLRSIGFTIKHININNTSNIWAFRGKGKTLTFAGHTDVVPAGKKKLWKFPPFDAVIEKNILFGRGAIDMKGALAAMIIAAEKFVYLNPNHKNRISFLITSDEESNAIDGTKAVIENLISQKEKIDYCILGEPSSTKVIGDFIKNGRRGSITAHLKVFGIQGHVAYPKSFDNSIHKTIPFLFRLINHEFDTGNNFFPSTSIQIVKIRSDSNSENVVPDELSMVFNIRFSPVINVNEIKHFVEKILFKYRIKYSIKWKVSGYPFFTSPGVLTKTVTEAVQFVNKIKSRLSTSGGTSDGRFISLIGAEIVELGLINKTIHQVNEQVKIEDLSILSQIYQRIMDKLLI
ncbi:succinyl-diaminopimelate desuccinylase [Buchnera aphidicola (Mindarus keteleerifoliae)]|uniref:succinyl-diaminopimelate desuccinylase n=1 Tax=Buchnera aphidicola TaxID=9 RepID=UPI0031B6E0B8